MLLYKNKVCIMVHVYSYITELILLYVIIFKKLSKSFILHLNRIEISFSCYLKLPFSYK